LADLNRIPGTKSLINRTYRRLRDIALWQAWWPFIVLLSVFLIAALLGAFERAPARIGAFATLLFFSGTLIAFLRGLSRYKRPDRSDAIQALDQQSELRPLASLSDRPARPEATGVQLWQAHEQRLTDAARRMSVPSFRSIWKRIDPLLLRGALPAALITLFVLSWGNIHSKLGSALTPDYGSLLGAENVRIEAWITPPAHTGRAPIFLKDDQQEARVPKGSVMTLRVQAPSAPKLRITSDESRKTTRFAPTPDGAYEATAEIFGDSEVSVHWWGARQSWRVLSSPDDRPSAQFVSVPSLGDNDKTDFTWAASDDFGIASIELAIRPEGSLRMPDRVAIELGELSPRSIEDETSIDLTRNRWAGSRVEIRLVATDGAGQIGLSEPHVFVLPEKLLLQPLAKAIQDIRVTVLREDEPYEATDAVSDSIQSGAYYLSATQRLSQAPAGVQRGAIMLDAVTYEGQRYFKDVLVYSGLTTSRYALEAAVSTSEAKSTEPLLWSLALRAEYGSAADASEEEIKRLMEAFKDAALRYFAAKMAEAVSNGLDAPQDTRDGAEGQGPNLGGDNFADMLDALEDLTETGASDQARQLLSDITNMLENLEFQQGSGSGEGTPGLPGEPGEGENEEDIPQEERELTDTMQRLSDLLREQRELNDQTLAQQRGERGEQGQQQGEGQEQGEGEQPGQGQQPGAGQPGSNGSSQFGDGSGEMPDWMRGEGEGGQTLAERQAELADRLERLAEGEFGGEEGEGGEGGGIGDLLDEDTLESVERSQRRAGNALEDGNEGRAIRNQDQATRQLRELAEGLAEQLDEAREARLGEGQQQGAQGGGDTIDPFGNSASGAVDDSNSVDIPDQAERQRAKDILDELRRRYDEAVDEDEREYLERLLDRF